MSQGPFLRKYNAATTINFDLFEVDGVDFRVDAVHAAGDTKIMKDEGVEANTGSGFVDEGQGYSIALTATEMSAARIVVYAVDQTATKVWLDTALVIETYGNASAQHAFDLDTASSAQTGDSFARLGAPAGASVSADIVVIDNFVDDLETRVPDTISLANINAEVDTALNTAIPGGPVANSVNERLVAIDDLTQAAGGGDLAAILIDVTGIGGSAMRGTDSAALASVCTEARLVELAAANLPTDIDAILADTGTDGVAIAPSAIGSGSFAAGAIDSAAVGAGVVGAIDKNVAFSNFEFLMVDSTDHVTPKTGLTVTGTRSIDGGAFAAVSGAIAEVADGIYQFDALAADTNGDLITWRFISAGADDFFVTFGTV